jgi:hypothetical protein
MKTFTTVSNRVAILFATLVLLPACGGDKNEPADTDTPPANGKPAAAAAAGMGLKAEPRSSRSLTGAMAGNQYFRLESIRSDFLPLTDHERAAVQSTRR